MAGWQKLRDGAKGPRQKVRTWTKILSPNICRYLRTSWMTLGRKNAILGQNSVSWAGSALLYGRYCILY